jgi:hypothetical protein
MHCPGCGQQQVSNETKFCSRCGMPLGVVAEVLVHGGFLPQLQQLNQKRKFFTKKNGVVFGIFWFIFFTMFSTAFLGILNAPDELIGIIAITGVFGAMMIILASLVFFPSSKIPMQLFTQFQTPPPPGMYGTDHAALPPQQSIPVSMYSAPKTGSWRDTSDLEPGSVTESTTKLLEKDEPLQ